MVLGINLTCRSQVCSPLLNGGDRYKGGKREEGGLSKDLALLCSFTPSLFANYTSFNLTRLVNIS